MIARLIAACARNRFLVFAGVALLVLAGIASLRSIPLDALPDISDVQVIVHTSWAGQPPQIIEDQVTYPLVTAFLGAPRVKAVRAQTMFGDSYVFVVFQDGTDLYWARSRVLELLNQRQGELPANVHPALGPDATGAGWVFEYVLVDKSHTQSLADLRDVQDWFLRYQLESVPGVAEVASIGGYQREYQVALDPTRLRSYGIGLQTVLDKVRAASGESGGGTLELGGARYLIRGLGYITSPADLEQIPLAVRGGVPIELKDVATVGFAPAERVGAAEWDGEGATVGGVVIMRYGGNALDVINGVKQKLAAIGGALPPGVEVVSAYDRSALIEDSIATLRRDLIEETVVVSLVIIVFLFHFRSALIPIAALPAALAATFLPMRYLHISSNIMSLGGLALAIGVLTDVSIVMVENGCRHLAEAQAREPGGELDAGRRHALLLHAAQQVGPALFYSLLIIVASFLPVFLLEAQSGRMFRPLAWTKSLSEGFASLLAITLVPALMLLFIRGRVPRESQNPIARVSAAMYRPVLAWCLRHRAWTVVFNLVFLALTLPLALHLGSVFMPPLYEGSALYMPTSLPGLGLTPATRLLQEQDRILRSFPEVTSVLGTVGRSDSATDNAPLDMFDTTIMLKPRATWPRGMTYTKLIAAMDAQMQFPGLTNTWTMPVEDRLDMELTGIKTPVGLKIQGPSLEGIQTLATRMEGVLGRVQGISSTYAERVADGLYINVTPNRTQLARFGLSIADVQQAVNNAIGGAPVATTVEGRRRIPIVVRYAPAFRGDLAALGQVLLNTPAGQPVPLTQVAQLAFAHGPAMIRDEDGALTGYMYINTAPSADLGGLVARADGALHQQLTLPAGYTYTWSGEYALQIQAEHRLEVVVPVVFVVIFILLYMIFHSVVEAVMLIFPTIYALSGGLLLQWWLGYPFSVAVWVGYIALFGIAIETGVVMVVYLREALEADPDHPFEAVMDGAVLRLRPKLMTVVVVLASLIPILLEGGVGSDVMKPIAAPIVGGMVTSAIHVLILVPVFFFSLHRKGGRLA